MERIRVLIARLKEQAEQNASPSQMLVTVQMLQNELYQLQVNGNFTPGHFKGCRNASKNSEYFSFAGGHEKGRG